MVTRSIAAILLALCVLGQTQALGQGVRTFREWESFEPGAWKLVKIHRTTREGQDDSASTSVTESRTTLVDKDEKGFTLSIEATVEIAGQRFPSQQQTVWYGYNGESKGAKVTSEKLRTDELQVDGQKIEVDVFRISIEQDMLRRELQAACSKQFPFVYQLRSAIFQPDGNEQRAAETLQADVTAIDMPYLLLGETRTVSHIRTTLERGDSKTITIELHCEDVPGRVVAHWAKKTDANGNLLEQSTLELIDFGKVKANGQGRSAPDVPTFAGTQRRK